MSFLEHPRFPEDISYGAAGGPRYQTDVIISDSGYESRNMRWLRARAEYDVAYGLRNQGQLDHLIAFFRAVKGRAYGFRFKDWSDYEVNYLQGVTVASDATTFKLMKRYVTGTLGEDREISKPIAETVKVYLDLVEVTEGFTLDDTKGLLHFDEEPVGTVTWSGEFDVPCRFNTDQMKVSIDAYNVYSWDQIPVLEVRV